jgi:hypothetical protein
MKQIREFNLARPASQTGKRRKLRSETPQMRIEILSGAEDDLITGARSSKRQGVGLGEYFLDSLYSDSP